MAENLERWYQDLEDDNWGDAADVFRGRIATLEKALAFAASCIKSGEPWTPTCDTIIAGALHPERDPQELDALRAGMQRIRAICKSPKSIRHRAGALVEIEAIAASTAPNAERDRHD